MFRISQFGPWLRRSRCDLCGRALGAHIWADLNKLGFVVACSIKDRESIDDLLSEILSGATSATDPGAGEST